MGSYTVTAQALNDCGESPPLSYQFTIGDLSQVTQGPPGTSGPATTETPVATETPGGTTLEPPANIPEVERRGDSFASLVADYIGESSVECIELNDAIEYKALAETAVLEANRTLAKILALAEPYSSGSGDVVNITEFAVDVHQEVLDVSISAGLATEQTEAYCLTATWASTNDRRDTFFHYAKGASEQAGLFAAAARQCKYLLYETLKDLETLVNAIEYDVPETKGIEKELLAEGASLFAKIKKVIDELKSVDSKMDTESDTKALWSLGRSRDTLENTKVELEGLQTANEEILSEQLEIKKLVVEEEIVPDYTYEMPLHMVLESYGGETTSASNWDAADQTDEEEWFSRFGHMVVKEIPLRLMMTFNETAGGCISENTTIDVLVMLTEVPKWETFYPAVCIEDTVQPGLGAAR
jgi:hypothetical protein